jgi:hypothetical protein
VAIHRILKDLAFEPDDARRMGAAYERALMLLALKDHNDPLTKIIAKLIIEVAQTGEKDPRIICALALRRLKRADRPPSNEAAEGEHREE